MQLKNNLQQTFRSQFFSILVLAILLFSIFYVNTMKGSISISERRFEKMMLDKDVEQVTLIMNQNLVEITLKKESCHKQGYKTELESRNFLNKEQAPHYNFKIPSIEIFNTNFKAIESQLPIEDHIGYIAKNRTDVYNVLINWGFLGMILLGFYFVVRRMTSGGLGRGIFNIGKSSASLFDADNHVKLTFNDVAGLKEAKQEVEEIVEFLKSPEKFTKLGGKIPKGALLIGPPGTGKTLLAKAVAGEASVPFFSISGSDFVEMFVGVGAARVRDLFNKAKEKAPAIIFIDEIDAIGRARGRGNMFGAGNDERESTLNSLLVEMDGFGTNSGIIILAATNRPDVLDPALLRPGRFDRQISIDKPDIIDREAILAVHMKKLKMSRKVEVKKLAAQTPGFAGAELANICNEAALIAARSNKSFIDMSDFQHAIDRVIGGLEKKNKIISPEEKQIVSYHEAGHAVASWFLEHAAPLVKVSIVPRGVAALGYAQYLPKEQFLYQEAQLLDRICTALGGRVAEEIIFNEISTGAVNDLERVTKIAYDIVTVYGMNKKIGHISFEDSTNNAEYAFNKPYSEHTAQTIDEEVRTIIDTAYKRVKTILVEKKQELEKVAKELLQKEVIFEKDLQRIVGPRPFPTHQPMNPKIGITKDAKNNTHANKQDASPVPALGNRHDTLKNPANNVKRAITENAQDAKRYQGPIKRLPVPTTDKTNKEPLQEVIEKNKTQQEQGTNIIPKTDTNGSRPEVKIEYK